MADRLHLRQAIAHLAAIERPSASPGEHEAAQWIAAQLAEFGCSVRVEEERAHGGYWFPLGVPNALAGAAGLLARRGGRRAARWRRRVGAVAAAAIWDDVGGGRLWFRRRFLPSRPTWNVVAETGDPTPSGHSCSSPTTTPPTGAAVPPRRAAARGPARRRAARAHQHLAAADGAVIAGPLLIALGALTGRRRPDAGSVSRSARPRRSPRSARAARSPARTTTSPASRR